MAVWDCTPNIPIELPYSCVATACNVAVGPACPPGTGEPSLEPSVFVSQDQWTSISPALVRELGLDIHVEVIAASKGPGEGLHVVLTVRLNVYARDADDPVAAAGYTWEHPEIQAIMKRPSDMGIGSVSDDEAVLVMGADLVAPYVQFGSRRK